VYDGHKNQGEETGVMKTKWGIRLSLIFLTFWLLAACKPLVGTDWTLFSLNGHELVPDTTITLSFTGEAMVGYGGCNHYGTEVEITNDTFIFDEIASTEFYCVEPEGNVEQEKDYLLTLQSVTTYSLSDGRLEMKNKNGDVVLIFTKGLPKNFPG
jgi:heat shock protein HslJ